MTPYLQELIDKRHKLMKEFEEYRQKKLEEYESQKKQRLELRKGKTLEIQILSKINTYYDNCSVGIDTDELDSHTDNMEEEIVEFFIKEELIPLEDD